MRNSILVFVFSLLFITSACSQSTPKTPKPPKTSSTGTSYSIDFDYDDDGTNSSVSVKKNQRVYKLTASFDRGRTNEIKKILLKKLGKRELNVTGSTYTWIKIIKGEEFFECKLTKGKLRFFIDKEYASSSFIESMVNFGDKLRDTITGSDTDKEEIERAKEELKRAEERLKRAKKQLERVKNKLKDS